MLWLHEPPSIAAWRATFALCRTPTTAIGLAACTVLGAIAGLRLEPSEGSSTAPYISSILRLSALLMALVALARWASLKKVTYQTLGARAGLVCFGAGSLLVAAAAAATLVGECSVGTPWTGRDDPASLALPVMLLAFRWGALVAMVGALPLGKWWGGVVAVMLGWLLPRAIPSFAFLDPGAPLSDLEHNSHTFVGSLADTGAILAFGVAAILLERRFRPTS